MSSSRNLQVMHVLSAFLPLLRVVPAENRWHHIVLCPVNQPLLRPARNTKLHGVGLTIMIADLARLAAEEINHSIVAKMQLPGLLQIHNSAQRDDMFERRLVCG